MSNKPQSARSYWTDKLSDHEFCAGFPHELVRDDTRHMVNIVHRLRDDLSRRMLSVANGSDMRLFAVCATAVAMLLRKYAGSEDVLINTTILRQQGSGPFINTLLPLRLALGARATGRESIMAMAQELRQATDHQNYPTRALDTEEVAGSGGLFRTFVLLDAIHDQRYLKDTKPDILFLFRVEQERVVVELSYDATLYTAAVAGRMLQHAEMVLRTLVFDVDAAIGRLQLASEETSEPVRKKTMREETIVDVFSRIANRWPDRIAVVDEERELSYAALDQKSDVIARLCSGDGARTRIVALAAGRCCDMIAGMLGILKTGAAYLPVDLTASDTRTMSMLAAAGVRTLVMTDVVARSHPALAEAVRYACLIPEFVDDQIGWVPGVEIQPEDLAYLIYTSGSTGSPRGVLVAHHSVVNLAAALGADILARERPARIGMVAPYTFDGSIKQIFGALLNGHTLHIVPETGRREAKALFEFLNRHRIEVVDGTPTHLRQWLGAMKVGLPPSSVHTFVVGGENLPMDLATDLVAAYAPAPCSVVNVYGLTECCDVATSARFGSAGPERRANVPVGRALAGCSVVVRDLDGQVSPPGPVGEILIGGEGVGRGYLLADAAASSWQAFEPLAGSDGYYRTGDLGRWLESGQLDVVGRKDRQLKIRGFRIEPSEVERIMRAATQGADCAVVAYGRPESLSLCGYYVARGSQSESVVKTLAASEHGAGELAAARPELAQSALGLAEMLLRSSGGHSDSHAVLSLCREEDTDIVAQLAVLRCGMRFIPAHLDWPGEYLDFIIETEMCRTVLVDCDAAHAAIMALKVSGLRVVNIEGMLLADVYGGATEDYTEVSLFRIYPDPYHHILPAYVKWRIEKALPAFMVPSVVMPVDALPLTPSGKLDRRHLPDPTASAEPYVAPANDIERQVVDIWASILGVDSGRIGRHARFLDLGGNSLSATLLLIELQVAFSVEIPLGDLFDKETVADLADYLTTLGLGGQRASNAQVVLISRGQDPDAVLCLMHDGLGQIESYVELGEGKPPFDLIALRPDGRDLLGPTDISIEALGASYAERLSDIARDRTLLLAGWSIGGLLAYAVADHLERQDLPAAFIGVMDVGPHPNAVPREINFLSLESERNFIERVFPEVAVSVENDTIDRMWAVTAFLLETSGMKPSAVLRRILDAVGLPVEGLTEQRGIPHAIRRGNLARSLMRAQALYRPNGAVSCQIDLFAAENSRGNDLTGWDRLTKGGVLVHSVPGDHFSMLRKPQVADLARIFFNQAERALRNDMVRAADRVGADMSGEWR